MAATTAAVWNGNLHPRVGGKFAPKGTGSTAAAGPRPAAGKTAKSGKSVAAPNGLGYSAGQWGVLQHLEAAAHAGTKLDAHQKHLLHVAHEKHLAAIAPKKAKAAPKAKVKKPKKAKAKAAPKPKVVVARPPTATHTVTIIK